MKARFLATVTGAALLASAVMPATAADPNERFVESQYRHDVMEHFSYAIKKLLANAKGEVAHRDHIPALANIMVYAASMTKSSFEKDTRGMEGKTEAKDTVWENWQDFAQRLDEMERDTKAFAKVANSTDDMEQIMASFKNVGRHCKSCHDEYKTD